jgi:hypothetical protein
MATTTPNFGWPVPTSTDLVKDGATAIEGLGDAIDASLLDLKGGTSGQVLAKNSGTDMDFVWVAQDDSNAIQNAIVDAKGDLIGATAADTPARLAVGTDGQVLTADSTAATGLAWSTISSTPTFVGCLITRTTAQSISNGSFTAITFDAESLDTDAFHSTVTNTSRITIPSGKDGKYLIFGQANFNANGTGRRIVRVYKNGANQSASEAEGTASASAYPSVSPTLILSLVATDYIELFVYQDSGGSLDVNSAGTKFAVQYLGA